MRLLIPGFSIRVQMKLLTDLAAHYGLPLVTLDGLVTQSIQSRTCLGDRARLCLENGQLIPDKLALNLIEERITEVDARQGWILAGFPRNMGQAAALNAMLLDIGQPYDMAIYLKSTQRYEQAMLPGAQAAYFDDVPANKDFSTPLTRFYSRLNLFVRLDSDMPLSVLDRALNLSFAD